MGSYSEGYFKRLCCYRRKSLPNQLDLGSYRRGIPRSRNVLSLNGYLTERVIDAEWLTPKIHVDFNGLSEWKCKISSWTSNWIFGLNRVHELPARFWLVYTQWNWLGYIIAQTCTEHYPFTHADKLVLICPPPSGGEVLPIMACKGRLRPKGVPFLGLRYIKG